MKDKKNKINQTKKADKLVTESFFKKYLKNQFDELGLMLARQFNSIDDRFDSIDKRFKQIDARFKQIDARFKQIDDRFDSIDKRFKQIDARFDSLFSEMHNEFRRVNEKIEELRVRIEFINKSRTEDIDAFGRDILKYNHKIKVLEQKVARLERAVIKK